MIDNRGNEIDNIFIEMFGERNAVSVGSWMNVEFNKEINQHPEDYINNENAKENKRNLISELIIRKYELDSVWYE